MGNDIARDAYCDITIGNSRNRDIHCDVTISNDVAVCTYVIATHNNVDMNLFYYILLCLFMLFYYG